MESEAPILSSRRCRKQLPAQVVQVRMKQERKESEMPRGAAHTGHGPASPVLSSRRPPHRQSSPTAITGPTSSEPSDFWTPIGLPKACPHVPGRWGCERQRTGPDAWFISFVHMPQFRPNLGVMASLQLSHFQFTPEQCGILFVNIYGCLWL